MFRCLSSAMLLSTLLGCSVPSEDALAQTGASGAANDVRARRMWAGTDTSVYVERSPSPNGKYMLEADSYGDFGIRDLATGEWHFLAEGDSDYVSTAIFSPDGDHVAAIRYRDDGTDGYDLWTYDFSIDESGIPGLANENPVRSDVAYAALFGWTRSDEILAGILRPDETLALALISASSGSTRVIKSLEWENIRAAITADGRLIAYDHTTETGDRDISLVTDGTRETTLVSGPGDDIVLGWMPGSHDLLFLSDRSGSNGVWRLEMDVDRPSGPPILLQEEPSNFVPLRFSDDAFYYQVRLDYPRYATAILDPETESLLQMPVEFADEQGGRIRNFEWSPDGEFVVHDVVRRGNRGDRPTRIVVRSADGQTILSEQDYDFNMTRQGLRWAPDGSAIFLNAFRDGEALRRIDRETGEVETIREFPDGERQNGNPAGFAISPDGGTLAFAYHVQEWAEAFSNDTADSTIVYHDLATGAERTLARFEGGSLEFSPDGKWLAALSRYFPDSTSQQTLCLFPSGGGEPRIIYSVENRPGFAASRIVGWSPDSAWVYFDMRPGVGQPVELWRAPADGGDPQVVARGVGVRPERLHPDGRTLAFRTGSFEVEVWALDQLEESEESVGVLP